MTARFPLCLGPNAPIRVPDLRRLVAEEFTFPAWCADPVKVLRVIDAIETDPLRRCWLTDREPDEHATRLLLSPDLTAAALSSLDLGGVAGVLVFLRVNP